MKAYHHPFRFVAVCVALLALSGCAETQLVSHLAKQASWPGQNENVGTYKVGNPYKIDGTWYYPKEDFTLVETGIASWYGPGFHAKQTANGEKFDQNELTAAHRTLQMPSLVRVTNLENGRSIVVRVNDRGPFKRGRVIDLSKRSAELLGFSAQGTAQVRLEVLERESRMLAEAARRGENTERLANKMRQNQSSTASTARAAAAPVAPVTASALPESLRTPTITVEELNAQAHPMSAATDVPSTNLASGHISQGRFVPEPVVMREAVVPTAIYVQAGSFSVQENAARLAKDLSGIAKTQVLPVAVNGRTMYRVRLGPIASVEAADAVLARVVRAGQGGARVIHD